MPGRATAKEEALAYVAAFEMPDTRKTTLVVGFPEQHGLMMVGFPEQHGLMMVGDKQP